jgi:hypothetical protein
MFNAIALVIMAVVGVVFSISYARHEHMDVM